MFASLTRFCFVIILSLAATCDSLAQKTQTIRGSVVELNTGAPLTGATVLLLDHEPVLGTITDRMGNFRLTGVPVGRQGIQVSFMGFHTTKIRGLDIFSGKEFTIDIRMEEAVLAGEEAVVRARSKKDQPNNEMAIVSARSFRMEETERFAGSWGDPARLVANFAGVISPADQSNDIIIRGNSPTGLLWRMEGVSIYNPNHFGSVGSTGGPISMINNNVLANSDFFTGAFPADYGNALSGVFDLNLRSGNNKEREHTALVGFNGFEFGTEGPISRNSNASYLASYRYSSLALFEILGLNMGVPAIPYYQDLSFKVDVPTGEKGRWSLFGLGGASHIGTQQDEDNENTFFRSYSETGLLGISHKHYFNNTTRLRTIISWGGIRNRGIDSTRIDQILQSRYVQHFSEQKYTFQTDLRKKFTRRDNLVMGVEASLIRATYRDSTFLKDYQRYITLTNTSGSLILFQSFISWKHKFSDILQIVAGLHHQQISLNSQISIEPRISMNWSISDRQIISAGYGKHSQAQPRTIYFTETLIDTTSNLYQKTNRDLGFTRNHQLVLGYQFLFNTNLNVKTELYYQKLVDVPITLYPSYISTINYGASFESASYDSLVNGGEGRNFGLELTLEHNFTDNYYYLATLSLFDSKYIASDGITRNTLFNGNYILNALGGYEWQLKRQNSISVDARVTWAGGLRMIPIDLDQSREAGKTVRDYTDVYGPRDRDYFRLDLRIAYKLNRPKSTWTFAADIQNLTNYDNPFFKAYNPETQQIEQVSHIGIIPAGIIRVNF